MQRIDRICEKVMHYSSVILVTPCIVVLVAWVFVFGIFVAARTFFGVSWQMVEEFTLYWLVLICFFSLPYTLWKGAHINIDIVIRLVPKKIRNILAVIADFLALALVCYLTSKGTDWFLYGFVQNIRSQTVSNSLLWPSYLLVPMGLTVLSLGFLMQLCRSMIRLLYGEKAEFKDGEK